MLDPGLRPSVVAMANSVLTPRIDSLDAIAWEELDLEQDALVLVLVSDHLAMRNNAFPLFPERYQRRLYFNVLNSIVAADQEIFATPLDISPTVLQLIGVAHDVAFPTGLNLLNTPMKDAVRDTYDPNRLDAIRYINSNHLSTV
jgi:hypothetical protein